MNIVDYLFEDTYDKTKNLLLGNTETHSYAATFADIIKFSNYLNDIYGDNKNILLISHNSYHTIVAYFAIIKSGNVCVPIDPVNVSTEKYINHIIETVKPVACVIEQYISTLLLPSSYDIIDNEFITNIRHPDKTPETSARQADPCFDGSRLAEIIFTSGSTALPKGVMITHDNIISNTESIIQYLQLTEDDIIEVVLPFHYCYGLSLLHTHIRVGGSIVLNNTFIFSNSVIDDLKKYACTGFAGVPSHFQILLRKSPLFKSQTYPALRYVTQAGGKLPNTYIKEFVSSFPDVAFYVMYGQTEATARLSYLPPEKLSEKLGSIGKGIPNVKLEVLDKEGRPTLPDEVGEVVASGNNIMKGYYEDPDMTQKTVRNGKLHTGDLATIDDEGYIYIVAREKEFIKVGGERISPKEIEETIAAIPEVIDCLITRVDDDILGEAVCAHIVLNDCKYTKEDIRDYCAAHLSINKIPKHIIPVDRIPTNSAGKKFINFNQ